MIFKGLILGKGIVFTVENIIFCLP